LARLFIAPLGFHEDFILRSLISLRITRGDLVYVVTCSPITGAVKRAYDGLTATLTRQGLPQPLLVEVNCGDFYGSFKKVRELVANLKPEQVFFCSGGGLRALTLTILLALVSLKKPFTVHYEAESGIEGFTVKPEFFLNLFSEPSEKELLALKAVISKPGISVKELSEVLGVKEKTARNIVTRLKNRGLVTKKGRREGVEPTEVALALYSGL